MNIAVCLKCIIKNIFREFNRAYQSDAQAADFSPLVLFVKSSE